MTYNFKNKTIFDFTDDKKILKEILGFDPDDEEEKDWYISDMSELFLIRDILFCAQAIENEDLINESEKEYDRRSKKYEKLVVESMKKGFIVD